MLTPLDRYDPSYPHTVLNLYWERIMGSHPSETNAALDAIDDQLRGFSGDADDPIPWGALEWTWECDLFRLRGILC